MSYSPYDPHTPAPAQPAQSGGPGAVQQELTTDNGVKIIVKNRPARTPEPHWRPQREPTRAIVFAPGMSAAERASFMKSVDAKWGLKLVKMLVRAGVRPRSAKDMAQHVLMILDQREQEHHVRPDRAPETPEQRDARVSALVHGIVPKVAANYRDLARNRKEHDTGAAETLQSAMLGPDEVAELEEEWAMLVRFLDVIPAPQREVIQLVDLGGMLIEEAAEALGRPLGTAASQRYRGLEKLRDLALAYQTGTLPVAAEPTPEPRVVIPGPYAHGLRK
jgi:RNA polymerase sigma factor (sigma-70 family)